VDAIGRYKDVVLVDSVEHLVIKQVKYAIRKCGKILAPNSYIGLTLVEEQCKIFTNLATVVTSSTVEASHPFGHYWFQLRSINFLPNVGFTMEVVVVRQFVSTDTQTCWKCKSLDTQPDTTPQVKIDSIGAAVSDMKSRLCHLLSELCTEIWQPSTYWDKLRPLLTVSTMVQMCKLVLVLLLAMVTGMVAGVKQLAQFSLRLLHELANLVDRSTPLALGALNIASKVVGGAYLLVAMIWRDTVKKPVGPPPPRPALTSLPPSRASLPPPPPPGVERLNSPNKPEYRGAMDSMYSQGRNW